MMLGPAAEQCGRGQRNMNNRKTEGDYTAGQTFGKDETDDITEQTFRKAGRDGTMQQTLVKGGREDIMELTFRKADEEDLDDIERIYLRTHDAEETGLTRTGWLRDIYPVRATAEAALDRDDMYIALLDGRTVAAGIINRIQVDVYYDCDWKYTAPEDKVSVLHTLVVDPEARGFGIGPAFVRFWEKLAAEEQNCTVLRIDTNARNLKARKMYASLGYEERDIVPTVFNGIPGVDLVLMEKPADRRSEGGDNESDEYI